MSILQLGKPLILFMLVLASMSGCTSIRTDDKDSPCLGFWIAGSEQQHQLVVEVLKDHGVSASIDSRGVVVKEEDQLRALEVLLTNQRLENSNLMMMVLVAAGTGQRTEDGMMAKVILGAENDGQKE